MALQQFAPPDWTEIDWHRWRGQGIGSSDAAAICGLDRWRTPLIVWLEKTGQLPITARRDNEAMRWGRALEPLVIAEFERRTGLHVRQRQIPLTHPQHNWMRATLDGLVHESADEEDASPLGVYEGKTTNGRDGTWQHGIPEYYILQVQHQLAVADLQHAWVAVLLGGQELQIHEIERDDLLVAELIAIEERFWRDCVLAGVPPAVDESNVTHEALRRSLANVSVGKSVELGPRALEVIARRQEAAKREQEAKREREAAESELMLMLGDAEAGLVNGQVVVTWKAVESQRFDCDRFRERFPRSYERFLVSLHYRRLGFPRIRREKPEAQQEE